MMTTKKKEAWSDFQGRKELKTDLDDKTVTLRAPRHDMGEGVVF